MDETTHGLSDKVLDRAFVLEFWNIDLAGYPCWGNSKLETVEIDRVKKLLQRLMEVLAPARLHFGWRVVDDVLGYLTQVAEMKEIVSFEDPLDDVVYAKILPKLRGEDSKRFSEALKGCQVVLGEFGLKRSESKIKELQNDLKTTGSARFWR